MAIANGPVILQLPAHSSLLRVARVAAASLAAELPFTVQDIEDLRIAVDEMAAAVIEGCDPNALLQLTMRVAGDHLEVEGFVAGAGPMLELHPVAADLLALVAPDFELGTTGADRTFRFIKRPQVHAS